MSTFHTRCSSPVCTRAFMLLLPWIGACAYTPPSPVVQTPLAAPVADGSVAAPVPSQRISTVPERLIVLPEGRAHPVRPEDIDRYRCEVGMLVCTTGSGRTSARYCKCS